MDRQIVTKADDQRAAAIANGERAVALANAAPDISFNLAALKYRLLLLEQICNKCRTETKCWLVIKLCHHKFCLDCYNSITNNRCLVCNIRFNIKEDICHIEFIKRAFSQVEELVYNIKGLENGTIKSIDPNKVCIHRTIEEAVNDNHNDENTVIQEAVEPDVIEQNTNRSHSTSSLSTNVSSVFIHNNDILMQNAVEINVVRNESPDVSDQLTNLTHSSSESSLDIFDGSQNIELGNEESDVEMDSNINNNQINEQSDNTDLSSICSSEIEDVIIGTPERNSRLPIILTYTGMGSAEEINIIKRMVCMFNLHAQTKWTEAITHLIVVVNSKGYCDPTVKFLNAMLRNRIIVNLQWVKDCVSAKKLLPELKYMALNVHGEPSPLISMKVGLGEIESPLKWCKNTGLYFHDSMKHRDAYQSLIDVAKQAGFVVLNRLEGFNECELKLRVILCNNRFEDNEKKQQPDDKSIMSWMQDYKAVTLDFDWFIDCIVSYKFIPCNINYQIMPMDYSQINLEELDESLFI